MKSLRRRPAAQPTRSNATIINQSNLHDREEQPARVVVDPHADGGLLALALEAERDGGVVAQVRIHRGWAAEHTWSGRGAGGHLGGDGPELDGDLGAVAVGGAVEAEGALDEVDRAAAERGAADEAGRRPTRSIDGAAQLARRTRRTLPTMAAAAASGGDVKTNTSGRRSIARWLRAPALSGLNDGPPAEGVGRAGS